MSYAGVDYDDGWYRAKAEGEITRLILEADLMRAENADLRRQLDRLLSFANIRELSAENAELRAQVAEAEAKMATARELADDLLLQMTANIPLGAPNVEWDPHDEFKRCAIDRRERVKRFHDRLRAALGDPEPQATKRGAVDSLAHYEVQGHRYYVMPGSVEGIDISSRQRNVGGSAS